MRTAIVCYLLGIALACGSAITRAEDQKTELTDPGALFDQLDKDKTGELGRDDVPSESRSLFDRLLRKAGKDRQAKLSKTEFVAALKDDKPIERPNPGLAGERGENGAQPNYEAMFKNLDKNGDGKLTLDEIPEERREGFQRILQRQGKGADGSLTKEEFVSAMKRIAEFRAQAAGSPSGRPEGSRVAMALALLKALDTDGNGELSSSEIAVASEVLKKMANREGKLTAKELGGERPVASASEGRPALGALREVTPEKIAEFILKRFDKNGDGKLSKEEAPEWLREKFDSIDTNKDGFLDENELKAARRELVGHLGRNEGRLDEKKSK